MAEGLIAGRFHLILTGLLFLIFLGVALSSIDGPIAGGFWVLASLILARLMALDLTHHTLPDIYVFPLALMGLLASLLHLTSLSLQGALLGGFIAFGVILSFSLLIEFLLKSAFLGGGDIKLITASGIFLGSHLLPFYMMFACAFTIFISFLPNKNHHIAFGPGLGLSLWLFLHQKDALMRLINNAFAFIS